MAALADELVGQTGALRERLTGPGGPFELMSAQDGPVFRRGPQTLGDLCRRAAAFRGRLQIDDGALALGFDAAAAAAAVLAGRLASRGVGNGARVSLDLRTPGRWVVALQALTAVGAVAVLLPAGGSRAELEGLTATRLRLVEPDAAATDEIATLTVDLSATGAAMPAVSLAPEDPALIVFTSGSSGAPKGVRLSHRNLLTGLNAMLLGAALAPRAAPPAAAPAGALVLTPLSHIGGLAQVLLGLMTGSTVVAPVDRSPGAVAALLASRPVRSVAAIGSGVLAEALDALPAGLTLPQLAAVHVHGAAVAPALVRRLAERAPNARLGAGYGLTETVGAICTATAADLAQDPTCAGQVSPAAEVSIRVGDAAVEPGRAGEICVRGQMVAQAYLTAAGEQRLRDADGWFHTGDVGRMDVQGRLYVDDRADAMQDFGAGPVALAALERAAALAVGAEAVAFSESEAGRRVVLAVAGRADPAAVRRAVAAEAGEAISLLVWPVAAIPRTASGKPDRRRLRETYAARSAVADAT